VKTMELTTQRAPSLRMTTGSLMVWVAAVAVALGVVKGDLVDWLPRDLVAALVAVTILATIFGIPFLSHQMARDPDVHQRPSASARRAEHLFVVGLLGLITASVILLGVLLLMIVQT
jgi:hypothetical protein